MMPKFKQALYAALASAPLAYVSADNDPSASPQATPAIMPYAPAASESIFTDHSVIERKPVPMATTITENSISPFTGKIRGKKYVCVWMPILTVASFENLIRMNL